MPGTATWDGYKTSFYEGFGVHNFNNTVEKVVYNNRAQLSQNDEAGNWPWWTPKPSLSAAGTSGEDEYNITGFAMRSKTSDATFAYNSSALSGGLFKFYTEVPYHDTPGNQPKKTVDKNQVSKQPGKLIRLTRKLISRKRLSNLTERP